MSITENMATQTSIARMLRIFPASRLTGASP